MLYMGILLLNRHFNNLRQIQTRLLDRHMGELGCILVFCLGQCQLENRISPFIASITLAWVSGLVIKPDGLLSPDIKPDGF